MNRVREIQTFLIKDGDLFFNSNSFISLYLVVKMNEVQKIF